MDTIRTNSRRREIHDELGRMATMAALGAVGTLVFGVVVACVAVGAALLMVVALLLIPKGEE